MDFAVACCAAGACIAMTHEPAKLTEVKRRYALLRQHLRHINVPKWESLYNECVLVGLWWDRGGGVGWNVNKGYEIGLCIDGTPNQIFHVLLHELAHCTVPEYEHSPQFWQNFRELRDIAVELKIYEVIPVHQGFCKTEIIDP